ncbi:MAG TPA: hypothetical protein VH253_18150 [Phycisphaerae bacterium]|nr:hypothetical protein [Phycisphaerae bacterium]
MAGQVNVEDFEVFRQFRAALLKFAQVVDKALAHADGEIGRMRSWLETEQGTFWQGQLRKRREMVTQARDAVRQKKLYLDSTGRRPSAVEEEKVLAKCLRAVEEAEFKIEAVKKALPRLEKEAGIYRGGVSRLMGDMTVEIPRAVTLLDRLAGSLEAYVQIAAPSTGGVGGGDMITGGEAMSRGGEAVDSAAVEEPEKGKEETAEEGAAKEGAGAAEEEHDVTG